MSRYFFLEKDDEEQVGISIYYSALALYVVMSVINLFVDITNHVGNSKYIRYVLYAV